MTDKKNYDYQWEILADNPKPTKDLSNFNSKFGIFVTQRNNEGIAIKTKITILIKNPNWRVFLVGSFNDWGTVPAVLNEYEFSYDEYKNFGTFETDVLKHKSEYKFLIKDNSNNSKFYVEDPSAAYFTDLGNSVFWDFEDPSTYKMKYDFIDTFNRSTKILQTDLPGLIVHYADKNGILGQKINEKNFYKFIAECGVINTIKSMGYNTIQFLPFAQNIDGTNWKFRYLVPFQYAIQKNWGNPDDFRYMIDSFHEAGIAVIGDFVLGHIPDRDFQIFGQSSKEHGIHIWKKKDGGCLYLLDETPWGTRRINFDDFDVRQFFRESCIHFMKAYKIDGFRIDNIDGIIRYGDAGQGDERPNGRNFLREINIEIYAYNPKALVNYEAHYYYEDNAKMLVAPLDSCNRALGATAYNSSRLTYYFHTKYMFLTASSNSIWKIKYINDEQEWGKSNATVADFHNHDAAAGLMAERCTGAYAYDCMMETSPANHIHALGKIKVMEAIISFCTEGRTLDLAQTFLLQTGTFEHDSSIRWYLSFSEVSKNLTAFKTKVNEIMDDSAFWPSNTNKREFLNVDDKNKVLVIERKSDTKKYVIVINNSDWKLYNYKVGVKGLKNYKCILNSDEFKYAGFGMTNVDYTFINKPSNNFELLNREFEIGVIPPYGIFVFEEI